jgi:thymidylate synthase (FAD)
MLKLAKEVAPILFKDAGPNCVKGACTEDKPCGKPWKKI